MNGLYGTRLAPANVTVSASAMNALMLAIQALVDPGAIRGDDHAVLAQPARAAADP